MLGDPVSYGQPCPMCGRCPTCGGYQIQQIIPGYPWKFGGWVYGDDLTVSSEAKIEPFSSDRSDDGHGDDGSLLAGP